MSSDEYYLNIVLAVREKANCKGRRVGAVLVKDNRIIATGYNGTPEGMTNCLDGGCIRCANRGSQFKPGEAYDVCICVHAEQNAILSAARFGIQTEGSTMYTSLRPCFNCSKAMLQAKINKVVYIHDWVVSDEKIHEQYKILQDAIPGGVHHVKWKDPKSAWANNK